MILKSEDDYGVAGVEEVRRAFWKAAEPEPLMTVSEWAEERRVLPRSTSGQPGPWDNSVTPYLVEIMDALSATSTVEEVVFIAGSQVGKTEVGNNWLGYIVDVAPGPSIFVLPTEGLAEKTAKTRLKPLFEKTPALKGKVKDAREPGGGSTLLYKEFAEDGFLQMVAAQAPSQLRSTPARYLFGDEVDGYPESSGDEGDPCELAARAQITFRRRKRFWTSTPTIEGHSKITKLFRKTDQRYYMVPCPHCAFEQRLVWENLDFDSKAKGKALRESIAYICSSCSERIPESEKRGMIAAGHWEATAESEDGDKARGYHMNALYSPFFRWYELAKKFLDAQGDNAALQVFINLYLAETWKEKSEVPDWNRLYERREPYRAGFIPRGGVFLTAGIDVQHNRFEAEVVAWGEGRESWSVAFFIVQGDTEKPETQRELVALLDRSFLHESGAELPIRLEAWDSGDRASMVYDIVNKRPHAIAVKGSDGHAQVISAPSYMSSKSRKNRRRKRSGAPVYTVGTHLVKEETYVYLRLPSPVEGDPALPGYCHFPQDYPAEYFKGLTAEQLVRRKNKKGHTVRDWVKTRERNEPLDCRVYARAGAAEIGLDRWTPRRWAQEREKAGLLNEVYTPKPQNKKRKERASQSRFSRWRR